MRFGEFDPKKSAANKAKHGIDFIEARDIWLDPGAETLAARPSGTELRYATVGFIGDKMWVAIWADTSPYRFDNDGRFHEPIVRMISAHRAEKTTFEKEYYVKRKE